MENLLKEEFEKSNYLELFRQHLIKYHTLSNKQVDEFLEQERLIPLSIFNDSLSILESVVKYLKEVESLNYRKIAEVLGRDERNIWKTYSNSTKKMSKKLDLDSNMLIPISIFKKEFGLYAIVKYLKEVKNMTYRLIGNLLKRNERTIWTTYNKNRRKG